MAILGRKIPWTEEPDGPQSIWLQGVRHDWATEPTCMSSHVEGRILTSCWNCFFDFDPYLFIARLVIIIIHNGLPLEKEIAAHSSILAWRIPWTEEPGRLQSMESYSRTQLKWLSMAWQWPASENPTPLPDCSAKVPLFITLSMAGRKNLTHPPAWGLLFEEIFARINWSFYFVSSPIPTSDP